MESTISQVHSRYFKRRQARDDTAHKAYKARVLVLLIAFSSMTHLQRKMRGFCDG